MKLSKNRLKFLRSLQQKKFRQKYQKFAAEGHKIALDSFGGSQFEIIEIVATESWVANNERQVPDRLKDKVSIASKLELSQLSQLKSPSEVMTFYSYENMDKVNVNGGEGMYFYLDNIQDPGNMGTIIRTAEWLGFQGVIKSPDSVDFYNNKVIQSTMGSFNRVSLISGWLSDIVEETNAALMIVGTDMHGQSIWKHDPISSGIIVIGNEGNGMRKETEDLCKSIVFVPSAATNKSESLNACISAGIVASVLTKKG